MRKDTHPPKKLCAICKRPIEQYQRPSVTLKNGDEVHVECHANGGKPPKLIN